MGFDPPLFLLRSLHYLWGINVSGFLWGYPQINTPMNLLKDINWHKTIWGKLAFNTILYPHKSVKLWLSKNINSYMCTTCNWNNSTVHICIKITIRHWSFDSSPHLFHDCQILDWALSLLTCFDLVGWSWT